MATRSNTSDKPKRRRLPPAKTPEARENQLINLAMQRAEEKLLDGTAPAQLIVHFLKLGTAKYKLENEKLQSDLEVAKAKIQQMESAETIKGLYEDVVNAMKLYSGISSEDYDDEYEEDDS